MTVPQLDLSSEYQQLRVEIDIAPQRVLASKRGNFIGGAENDALERELADYIDVAGELTKNVRFKGTQEILSDYGVKLKSERSTARFRITLTGAQGRVSAPSKRRVMSAYRVTQICTYGNVSTCAPDVSTKLS